MHLKFFVIGFLYRFDSILPPLFGIFYVACCLLVVLGTDVPVAFSGVPIFQLWKVMNLSWLVNHFFRMLLFMLNFILLHDFMIHKYPWINRRTKFG